MDKCECTLNVFHICVCIWSFIENSILDQIKKVFFSSWRLFWLILKSASHLIFIWKLCPANFYSDLRFKNIIRPIKCSILFATFVAVKHFVCWLPTFQSQIKAYWCQITRMLTFFATVHSYKLDKFYLKFLYEIWSSWHLFKAQSERTTSRMVIWLEF